MRALPFDTAKPQKKTVPFSFVLENLGSHEPVVKPMFGCYAVYIGPKIYFLLRHKSAHPEVNGVWVVTTREHHSTLRKEFPSLGSVTVLGPGDTNWQMIHEDAPDFESSVLRICELVAKGDPRIGRIPARKKKSKPKAEQTPPRRKRKVSHD